MNKNKNFLFTILILILVISTACSSAASSEKDKDTEVIKLKVADSLPTTNPFAVEGIVYFMDRVKELTDGKVEFEYYPAEQIGKASSYLDLALSKTIDIGYTSYSTDRLPLTEVGTLPGAYSNAQEGTEIMWEIMNEMLIEEEYLKNNVRPLFSIAAPQYQLITRNHPVKSLADIKGLKTRVTGTMELAFDELGASPVFMPATEAYTALERGTVDGVTFSYLSFSAYQIDSIGKYTTKDANLGGFIAVYSINESVYQGLPDDIKEALKQAAEETMVHAPKVFDDEITRLGKEYATKMEMYELSDVEAMEWDQALEPVWKRWAASLEKRGYKANEVVEKYRAIQKEIRK